MSVKPNPASPAVQRAAGITPATVRPGGRPVPSMPRDTQAPHSPAGLALPHERDESPDAPPLAPDPVMLQAHADLAAGQVDTDMRATPGLDAGRRADLVPGAGGKPRGQPGGTSDSAAPRPPRR